MKVILEDKEFDLNDLLSSLKNFSNEIRYHKYCVYLTINTINNKFYIGFSSNTVNVISKKYVGSGIYLLRAVRKYGIENFETFIVQTYETAEKAFSLEKQIVNAELVQSNQCYNIKTGGKGGWNAYISEEHKKEVYQKIVNTNKLNRSKGLTYLSNSLVDSPEKNISFRKKLKIVHNTKKVKLKHSIASKKNWESEEYRTKIPKRNKGFRVMTKNEVFVHIYEEDERNKLLSEGWRFRGHSIEISKESKMKQIKSLQNFYKDKEKRAILKERQKTLWSDPVKKESMLKSFAERKEFNKLVIDFLQNTENKYTNMLFTVEMIRIFMYYFKNNKQNINRIFSKKKNMTKLIFEQYIDFDVNKSKNNLSIEFHEFCNKLKNKYSIENYYPDEEDLAIFMKYEELTYFKNSKVKF